MYWANDNTEHIVIPPVQPSPTQANQMTSTPRNQNIHNIVQPARIHPPIIEYDNDVPMHTIPPNIAPDTGISEEIATIVDPQAPQIEQTVTTLAKSTTHDEIMVDTNVQLPPQHDIPLQNLAVSNVPVHPEMVENLNEHGMNLLNILFRKSINSDCFDPKYSHNK